MLLYLFAISSNLYIVDQTNIADYIAAVLSLSLSFSFSFFLSLSLSLFCHAQREKKASQEVMINQDRNEFWVFFLRHHPWKKEKTKELEGI